MLENILDKYVGIFEGNFWLHGLVIPAVILFYKTRITYSVFFRCVSDISN